MRVSLVLTTYNGEKYIIDQLDSILRQTRMPDEVLIFDDRSTDHTVSIVSDYIRKHELNNWTFTVNRKNKGWRRNFMEGLRAATGDIVFIADQDDIWMPSKIELMSRAMEEYPEISLLACQYQPFEGDQVPVNNAAMNGGANNTAAYGALPVRQKMYPNIFHVLYPGCTYCVSKELIQMAGEYWTEDTAHDELLWRIALFGDSLFIYPQKLICWRRHKDSSWAHEGAKHKTPEKRLKWTAFARRQIKIISAYLGRYGQMTPKKAKILKKNAQWIRLRRRLFADRQVRTCFELFFYRKYYNSFKQYLGDIYIAFFK